MVVYTNGAVWVGSVACVGFGSFGSSLHSGQEDCTPLGTGRIAVDDHHMLQSDYSVDVSTFHLLTF